MAKGTDYNATPITAAFNGASLGTYTPSATSFAQVTTGTFTATAATGSLSFAGSTSTGPQITAIDKISIVAVAPSIVVPSASFEVPDIGNGSEMWNPSVAGASFVNYAGVAGNATLFYHFPSAPDGDQVGIIAGSSSSIALSVSGLVPGSTYAVKFSMAKGTDYSATPITAAFNGTALGTYASATTSFAQITTASFTATAATGSLTFAGSTTTAPQITAIDKISIVVDLGSEIINYTYDVRGRLVKVENTGSINPGVTTQYQHDKAGNRTNVTVTGSPNTPPP